MGFAALSKVLHRGRRGGGDKEEEGEKAGRKRGKAESLKRASITRWKCGIWEMRYLWVYVYGPAWIWGRGVCSSS